MELNDPICFHAKFALKYRYQLNQRHDPPRRRHPVLLDSTHSLIRSNRSDEFEHSMTKCTTNMSVDICSSIVMVIAAVGVVAWIVHEMCRRDIDGVIPELIVQCYGLFSTLHGIISIGSPVASSNDDGMMTRLYIRRNKYCNNTDSNKVKGSKAIVVPPRGVDSVLTHPSNNKGHVG